MSYSQSWLEDPQAIRMVLVTATVYDVYANQEVDIYLSNSGYTTTDGVTFYPVIVGKVGLSEKISPDYSISMSWGDIEITNKNGDYDKYLDISKYVWINRSIKIYYGDPRWQCSLSNIPTTFLKIFDGIIADCDTRNIRSFNIKLRDKLERLNGPITEAIIGDYGTWASGQQNKDQLKPIILGEVFNVKPVLLDPSTLEYIFSSSNPKKFDEAQSETNNIADSGAAEELIEVRDNGAPIFIYSDVTNYPGASKNLAKSTFNLTSPPAGEITVSAQGIKKSVNFDTGAVLNSTYSNTIAQLIAVTVLTLGKESTRLVSEDIDLQNFKDFNIANPVPAGIYLDSAANVLEVCQQLAGSIGASIFMSRLGKLQLLKFGQPYGTSTIITPNDILFDTFQISERLTPKPSFSLNWGKNWAVQTNITTAIPAEHKEDFAKEWLEAIAKDDALVSLYSASEVPTSQRDTLLIDTTSAETEVARLLNYFKIQRTVYSFTGSPKLLSLKLGQPVVLQHSRFGLESGKSGQVVTLNPDWTKGYVEVEVIV